jgi:putative uncharacterized protein (fragment)
MNRDFDPYKILDVEKDASIDNIKKSFKQKSKVMHPDTGGSIDQFNTLKKAYDILVDASKREIWDEYRIADNFNIEDEAKTVDIQIVLPVKKCIFGKQKCPKISIPRSYGNASNPMG